MPVNSALAKTKMKSKKEAQKEIEIIISGYEQPSNDCYVIVENETIEKEWGWVFFYTSKKWLETNELIYAVAGNAPFIVERSTGKIIITGTANGITHYIERFEATGDPNG